MTPRQLSAAFAVVVALALPSTSFSGDHGRGGGEGHGNGNHFGQMRQGGGESRGGGWQARGSGESRGGGWQSRGGGGEFRQSGQVRDYFAGRQGSPMFDRSARGAWSDGGSRYQRSAPSGSRVDRSFVGGWDIQRHPQGVRQYGDRYRSGGGYSGGYSGAYRYKYGGGYRGSYGYAGGAHYRSYARPYCASYYSGYFARPRFAYHRGFSVGLAVGFYPSYGCSYYDPYCDETFSCLDDYYDHCCSYGHPTAILMVDDGYPVATCGFHSGRWIVDDCY
jgi:hypothetical protein